MAWKGKAKFGVSVIYKGSSELRFTNLTEQEARHAMERLGKPNDITTSKQNGKCKAKDTKEQARELANKLRHEIGFNALNFNIKRKPSVVTEYDKQIKTIRRALKSLCPTLSVRRGRGTAYSWIDIWGSGEFGEFTDQERKALEKFGLNYGGNCALISPESRNYYVEKAKQF